MKFGWGNAWKRLKVGKNTLSPMVFAFLVYFTFTETNSFISLLLKQKALFH